jgi:hypothetical protein
MTRRTLGKQLRVQVLARDDYRCSMCGRTSADIPLEVDHVIPVSAGGTDELSNLAALCRDCNVGKSAYRFADYRAMNVIPEHLTADFRFFHDAVSGDFHRFQLYLYFKRGVHAGATDDKFHHSWTIAGTAYDISSNPAALVARRRAEEKLKFLTEIRTKLITEGARLVRNEEGVCRVER